MKLPTLFSALVLLAATVSPGRAEEPAPMPAGPPAAAPEHKKPETELEGKMEKMNKAFRKLRRQVSDPTKNAESVELAASLHENAEAASKLVPAKAATLPEADRAKFTEDYKAKMAELIEGIGKLEDALKANNNEEAGKVMQSLGGMQKEGHHDFRVKEEH